MRAYLVRYVSAIDFNTSPGPKTFQPGKELRPDGWIEQND